MRRTEDAILAVIREMEGRPVTRETNLNELSADMVELQFALETGLAIVLRNSDMAEIHTVGELADKCLAQ